MLAPHVLQPCVILQSCSWFQVPVSSWLELHLVFVFLFSLFVISPACFVSVVAWICTLGATAAHVVKLAFLFLHLCLAPHLSASHQSINFSNEQTERQTQFVVLSSQNAKNVSLLFLIKNLLIIITVFLFMKT